MVQGISSQVANDFAKPDVGALKMAPKNMLYLFNSLETSYLPSLREKSQRLVGYVQTSNENLKHSLIESKAKLESQNIASYTTQLERLFLSLNDPALPDMKKKLLSQAADQLRGNLQRLIVEVEILFSAIADRFFDELSRIEDVLIEVHIPDALQGKSQQKRTLEKALGEIETQKQLLITRKNMLIDSLDIMRRRNLIDMFSDYLPTDQEIEGLNLTQPEVEALKQGINLYRKMAQNLSEGVEYAKLADARDQLYRDIEKLNQEGRQLSAELSTIQHELQDVSSLAGIDAERDRYVAEARKLLNSLDFFSARLHNLLKLEMYSEISKLLDEKLHYLNAILREYK